MTKNLESVDDYLRQYPRICSHIIAESLGYAVPRVAGQILKDAREGNENWCEWIYSCYDRDPRRAVQGSIDRRHSHTGYMAEYAAAKAIVDRYNKSGDEPLLASWF